MNRPIIALGIFAITTNVATLVYAQEPEAPAALFARWLVIAMDGSTCDAIAVCDEGEPSCDAIVLSCDGPVRLSACLNEASAYTPAEAATLDGELEPIYGLGCSTDLSAGWPSVVVFDRDELERATDMCESWAHKAEAERNHGTCAR